MIEVTLLAVGVVAHWLKKLAERRQETGRVPNPVDAFLARPYHVVWTTLLAVAVGVALHEMGQLNPANALLLGFSADSAAAALKRRAG